MYDRSIKMYDESHSPQDLELALSKGNLNKGKFLTFAHSNSYYLQMLTINNLNVGSVLEVGPGENFVANYMRSIGIKYETIDITEDQEPTILGKLEDIDTSKYTNRYNLVCAFQMLEHSPYKEFTSNLKKMAIMSNRYVFISLPYACYGLKFSLSFTFGQNKNFRKSFSLYLPLNKKNRRYREEYKKEFSWAVHYWEIGRKGFPLKRIKADIESSGLRIIDTFHSDNPYHYFILTEK